MEVVSQVTSILGFVDRESLYNLVKWNQLGEQFILVIFIDLYMFRTTMRPSSGETNVFMWHLVLVILCRGLSGMQEHMLLHTRQSPTQNNKYQVSHKHSCFSWWWTHSRPKHVEIDKYTKNKLCTKLALFSKVTSIIFSQYCCWIFLLYSRIDAQNDHFPSNLTSSGRTLCINFC